MGSYALTAHTVIKLWLVFAKEENDMKRWVSLLLAIVLALGACVSGTGCGKKGSLHILTRGEWIGQLADSFGLTECYDPTPIFKDIDEKNDYFNEIQACAEWDVIDKTKKFQADEKADVNFAVETAVRMIGVNRIAKSVGGKELKNSEDYIDYFNENSDVKYISGQSLYKDTALTILSDTQKIDSELQLEQYEDVEMTDAVVETTADQVRFQTDGMTGQILSGQYQVGDVIAIDPCTEYPEGKYAKIIEINDQTFTYTTPELEDMYSNISVWGTYDLDVMGVVPLSEDVQIDAIDGEKPEARVSDGKIIYASTGMQQTRSDVAINVPTIEMSMESGPVTGTVSIANMQATIGVESTLGVVKEAEIGLTDSINAELKVSGKTDKQYTKSFRLAKIPCRAVNAIGVDVVLMANVSVSGEVSLSLQVGTAEGISYRPLCTPKFHAQVTSCNKSIEAKADLSFKPIIRADVVVGPVTLANVGAYSGANAAADAKIYDDNGKTGTCIDVSGYVPLVVFIDDEGDTVLGKIGVKKTFTIWNEGNSKLRFHYHFEDFKQVEECTHTGEDNKEDTEEQEAEHDEELLDESFVDEEAIDNINQLGGYLSLHSMYIVLDEGASASIGVDALPEGYTAQDMAYSSDNPSVVSVDGSGMVYAHQAGDVIITIKTTDGQYRSYCAVHVSADYHVDFTPLEPLLQEENLYAITI